MEELIQEYLFQYKQCPLPAIGSLQVRPGTAVAWHGDNKLSGPIPYIEFTDTEIPADNFIAFIAAKKNIPVGEASVSLHTYCLALQKMKAPEELKLEHAGTFQVDEYGKLLFKHQPLPKEFTPTIRFQRVSHNKVASHAIRVGDTETTNEVMTQYFNEKEKIQKEYWWIWALSLTVIATAALVFYFSKHKYTDNFGNVQPITTSPIEKTYRNK